MKSKRLILRQSDFSIWCFLLFCIMQLIFNSSSSIINYGIVVLFSAYVFLSTRFRLIIVKEVKWIVVLYALSCLYMFISFLFARNLSNSSSGRIKTVIILTLIAILLIAISRDRVCFSLLLSGVSIILLVSTVIGFLRIGSSNLFRLITSGTRIIESFGTEFGTNYYAMVSCVSFITVLYFALTSNRFLYFLALPPLILALASGSRKAIVSILLGVVLLLFFLSKKKSLIMLIKWLLIIGIVLFIIYRIPFFDAITERISTLWNRTNDIKVSLSDAGRANRISWGFSNALNKPLFGHGFNAFGYYYGSSFGTESYAHNNYIQLLFDQGIVGFLLYYSYVLLILKKLFAIHKTNDCVVSLLLVLCILTLVFDWGSVTYYQFLSKLIHMVCCSYLSMESWSKKLQKGYMNNHGLL